MIISSRERCANREAVESQSPTLPKATLGYNVRCAGNPVRVATIVNRIPNVAAARQRWAGGRNRFAVIDRESVKMDPYRRFRLEVYEQVLC